MSVHYLVDYENVHESGIYGMNMLTPEDCVYLFHTSTTERITLSCLDDIQAWVKVILVPPGKQSLDMHLGSFLGYLIGKEEDPDTKYAIVSHDTDYRGITDFWNRSYQTNDKVQCLHGISAPLFSTDVCNMESNSMDQTEERITIHEFITRAFSKHGFISQNRMPCMLVSELCTLLNNLPAYNNARKRLGKKPMQYLREECRDILWVDRKWNQDWVYLLGSHESDAVVNTNVEPQQDTVVEVEAPAPEDEIPDIIDIGDLEIDDDSTLVEECADEEAVSTVITGTPLQDKDEQKEPELLSVAMAFILNSDSERNANGYVRASALRDELMKHPEFRCALKESRLKPIPYIGQLFPNRIRVYQENGVFWAAVEGEQESGDSQAEEGMNPVIEDRQKKFFEQAFANIQKRLSDAGLDQTAADEIADICMHSYTEIEPRKAIHNLLCQRYGTKIGAQYYRKAIKYVDIA